MRLYVSLQYLSIKFGSINNFLLNIVPFSDNVSVYKGILDIVVSKDAWTFKQQHELTLL